ncbi:CPBP family intramembrane glutamic endopeptidase [Enterococcus faecalis]|uniref:CPBP family intramembrane glutamic endopeptidase n=1 Tax=Enterococcus faecalis TaxID=1351 RepID=UPI002DBFEC81|nr:type II CAAX endopeptidase family protein [Enterococcus faecalis]MEB7792175.1 CPBP family intramembrane metalloprotease [Enterococcus faecalis]MEB7810181.1 CPBP family intramembrane metalloprotease [Enterococcus faecalis]
MVFIRKKKKEFILLLVYILFTVLQLGILPIAIVSLKTGIDLLSSTFLLFLINLGIPSICGIVMFQNEIIHSLSYFKEKTLIKVISVPLVIGLIVFIESSLMNIFFSEGTTGNQDMLLDMKNTVPLWLILVLFSVLGPIVEELVFRLILVGSCSEKIGVPAASIISIFIFTFMHTQQPIDYLIYTPGAIILTLSYLLFRSIISIRNDYSCNK